MTKLEEIVQSGGLIGLLVAAATGFIGWRIGTATDSVKLENTIRELGDERRQRERDISILHEKMERLNERDSEDIKKLTSLIAGQSSTLSAMADQLGRIHDRMDRLERRPE